jgi:hypothetical protein
MGASGGQEGMPQLPPELLEQVMMLQQRLPQPGQQMMPEGMEELPGYGPADDADFEALEAFLSGE